MVVKLSKWWNFPVRLCFLVKSIKMCCLGVPCVSLIYISKEFFETKVESLPLRLKGPFVRSTDIPDPHSMYHFCMNEYFYQIIFYQILFARSHCQQCKYFRHEMFQPFERVQKGFRKQKSWTVQVMVELGEGLQKYTQGTQKDEEKVIHSMFLSMHWW